MRQAAGAFLASVLCCIALPSAFPAEPIRDFESLQRACDQAPPGATLVVPAGSYEGQLEIRRPLTLTGPREAILRHLPFKEGPTLSILADDVVLRGITVSGSGEGRVTDHYAILVAADRAHIESVAVRDAWGGVYLRRSNGSRLLDLELVGRADWLFFQRGDAVHVLGGFDTDISGLRMEHWADGVYVDEAIRVTMRSIRGRDLRYGVHGMFSFRASLEDCSISDSLVGLMLMESKAWTVRDCSWSDCLRPGGAGLRVVRSTECGISDSASSRNLTGVQLLDARDCLFERLRVGENGTGFRLGGLNQSSDITRSTIRGNLVQVSADALLPDDVSDAAYFPQDAMDFSSPFAPGGRDASSLTAARAPSRLPSFMMNYWDDWKGYDLDGDGIGDSGYRLNAEASALYARYPQLGIFLGSPYRSAVEGFGSGEVIDPLPLFKAP